MSNENITEETLQDIKRRQQVARNTFATAVVVNGLAPEIHPIADKFAYMQGAEWEEFKASIVECGIIEKPFIITEEGVLVDGRNRMKAYLELRAEGKQINPRVYQTEVMIDATEEQILARIKRSNVNRRHLDPKDRAAMAIMQLETQEDTRSDAAKVEAARKATLHAATADGNKVEVEEKVGLNAMVCDTLEVKRTAATNHIERATDALGMTRPGNGKYAKSDAVKVLKWLGDNPEAPKTKPKAVPRKKKLAPKLKLVDNTAPEKQEEPTVEVKREIPSTPAYQAEQTSDKEMEGMLDDMEDEAMEKVALEQWEEALEELKATLEFVEMYMGDKPGMDLIELGEKYTSTKY